MIESNEANMGPNKNSARQAAAEEPAAKEQSSASASEGNGGKSGESKASSVVDELKKKIEELEAQLKEKDSKFIYLYADFENFKKRAIKERSDLIKFGWEPTARDLLQNLDDLERALAHVHPSTDKSLTEGLNMVLNQFKSTLQKQGVQAIESLNKEFDPNLHEAVGQEESDLPAGTVSKEHSRGYTLHGRLLRPARVIVSGGRTK